MLTSYHLVSRDAHRKGARNRAGLVKCPSEHRWSSYEPPIARVMIPFQLYRWPEDVKTLAVAAGEVAEEMIEPLKKKRSSRR